MAEMSSGATELPHCTKQWHEKTFNWWIWQIVVNLPKFYLPNILTNGIVSCISHVQKQLPKFCLPLFLV